MNASVIEALTMGGRSDGPAILNPRPALRVRPENRHNPLAANGSRCYYQQKWCVPMSVSTELSCLSTRFWEKQFMEIRTGYSFRVVRDGSKCSDKCLTELFVHQNGEVSGTVLERMHVKEFIPVAFNVAEDIIAETLALFEGATSISADRTINIRLRTVDGMLVHKRVPAPGQVKSDAVTDGCWLHFEEICQTAISLALDQTKRRSANEGG